MRIPKNYNQVTVEQYQLTIPILNKIKSETDAEKVLTGWAMIISFLTGKPVEEIEDLPIDNLTKIVKSLSWLGNEFKGNKRKYLLFKGRIYRAQFDASKLNTAQYVEVKSFIERGNPMGEFHNILASIYSPLTLKGFRHDGLKHANRAELFKHLPIGKVYPTLFFYSVLFKTSMKDTLAYGLKEYNQEMKKAEKLLMETLREISQEIGDGT